MAKINIGGNETIIPEMNFVAVERAWPYIEAAMATVHPIDGVNAAIAVIAAALMEADDYTPERYGVTSLSRKDELSGTEVPKPDSIIHMEVTTFIKRKLKANEMGAVKLVLFEMLEEAGFEMSKAGELQEQGSKDEDINPAILEMLAMPSTETVPDTSPSSLPPESKQVAGTPSTEAGASSATG